MSGYTTGGFAWTAAQNLTPLIVRHRQPTGSGRSIRHGRRRRSHRRAAIIYNSSASNKAVYVGSFGGTQTVSAGTLTLVQPTNGVGTSLLQLN